MPKRVCDCLALTAALLCLPAVATRAEPLDVGTIRARIEAAGLPFTVAESWVTQLDAEGRERLLGAPEREDCPEAAVWTGLIGDRERVLIDWTDMDGQSYVSGVRNQGGCGSCWAFASVAMLESSYMIGYNLPDTDPDFSEQYVLSCIPGDHDCTGGNQVNTLDFLRDEGTPTEECFPYEADDQIPCSDSCPETADELVYISSWSYVCRDTVNLSAMKDALADGPIGTWFRVYDDFFAYDDGVYVYDGVSEYVGNHYVLIVGCDDDAGCWRAKNSWGGGWGEEGYFRIAYESGCDFGWWTKSCTPEGATAAPEHASATGGLHLLANHPNPFNPSTEIRFVLPEPARVELAIFGVSGRWLRTLAAGELGAGEHAATWDGRDDAGAALPAGVYLCRLEAAGMASARKLLLLE